MLTLRDAQLEVLGKAPQRQFEIALAKHLGRYFPHECERGDVPRFVRLGIERAEYHACETQREVALYLNLMVMLGCDFDRDPQIPWAGRDIDHPSIPSIAKRIAHVSEAALRFLGETAGQNNSHLVRAMLRIKRNDTSALDGLQEDDLPEGVLAFLTALYPEKAAWHGDECMEALTEAAIASARERGAVAPRAVGIHALHMFMLGVGYDRDPLYNWLGDRLDDAAAGPVDARFGRMMEASIEYIGVAARKQEAES